MLHTCACTQVKTNIQTLNNLFLYNRHLRKKQGLGFMCLCITMEVTPRHGSGPGAMKQKRTSLHYILHTIYTVAGGFLFQASESQFPLLVPLILILPIVKNFKPRNTEGGSHVAGTPFTSIPRWWHCSFTHLSLDTRDPGPRS